MNLKRSALVGLFVFAGLIAAPASASALAFEPSPSSPLTILPPDDVINGIATGDFDGNGNEDIATVSETSNKIFVFLAKNDGTGFEAATGPYGTGSSSPHLSVRAGDFGGDSALDLLVGSTFSHNKFETFLGDGAGGFSTAPDSSFTLPGIITAYNLGAWEVGDVNDDGILDFVAGMRDHSLAVALGTGDADGSFTVTPETPINVPTPNNTTGDSFDAVAIGDYDNDDDADVALAFRPSPSDVVSGIYVANGDGDGVFTPRAGGPIKTSAFPGMPYNDIATIDLNGDAPDDLSISSFYGNQLDTMVGSGSGLVNNPNPNGGITNPGGPGAPWGLAIADFDDDETEDIAATISGSFFSVALNEGGGAISLDPNSPFAFQQIGGLNMNTITLNAADFNGDNLNDIATYGSHTGYPDQARGIDVMINSADVSVSPSSIDFPDTGPEQVSPAETVTIENTGAVDVDIDEIEIPGDDPQFDFDSSGCPFSPASLEAGDSCEVEVTFAPTELGSDDADLVIEFDGDVPTETVNLTGSTGEPSASIDPSGTWDFGTAVAGYPAARVIKEFTITSNGGQILELDGMEIFEENAEDFQLVSEGTCTGDLLPDDSCKFEVAFAPKAGATGERFAVIALNYLNADTDFVELYGTVGTAGYTLSPVSADFGEWTAGTDQEIIRNFEVTSTGTAGLPVAGTTITGPDAASYSVISPACPAILAPGEICYIDVKLDVKNGSPGVKNATLNVNAGTSPADAKTASLTGTLEEKGTPKFALKLKAPKKVKRGKTLTVTAKLSNVGSWTARPVTLSPSVPTKLAKKPKAAKFTELYPDHSVTKKFKIKVKKSAKRGKKLVIKVAASAPDAAKLTKKLTVKIR